MSKRKHADIVQAWLDGKDIEVLIECMWCPMKKITPISNPNYKFRVKTSFKEQALEDENHHMEYTNVPPINKAWIDGWDACLQTLIDQEQISSEQAELFK